MKLLPALAVLATLTATGLHAETARAPRLLLMSGLCPQSFEALKDWAMTVKAHASYALPTPPLFRKTTCDTPADPAVQAAYSHGGASPAEADKAALDLCNSLRPKGYGRCVVVARVE